MDKKTTTTEQQYKQNHKEDFIRKVIQIIYLLKSLISHTNYSLVKVFKNI